MNMITRRIFKFVHFTQDKIHDGKVIKGGIRLGMIVDLSDPQEVTITYIGGECDEYLLSFVSTFDPDEIKAWTEWLTKQLFAIGELTGIHRDKVQAGQWRHGGWTGQPLNKPFPLKKKDD